MYTKLLKLSKYFQPLEKNRTGLKIKHVKNRKFASDVQIVYEVVPKCLRRRCRQHEFHNSSIKIVLTRQPCSISCNLLLHKLDNVNFLLSNRFSYIEFQSQKTALNPRSFTCSSFLQSELLQKCQNNPQYVRYDNIAGL